MTKNKMVFSSESVQDLDSEDRVRVLGIIDQFRELGINEDVSLPQLVVVGDQSSGKSSLLEGLTGLNFPIASELCTRFATQIVLRRDVECSVKVTILPGPTADDDEDRRIRLQTFARIIDGDLDTAVFAQVLNEAAVAMGLPGTDVVDYTDLPKRFSDDVLRIELSGPDHHHLSVVDVPGLFHNPTQFQTQEDLEVIRAILEGYIVDPRTIILAVMDARNNLANQEVFNMARAADPEGKRTVGIITKCDAVQAGDETSVLEIAQNTRERLTHGWFAVRNRSTQEINAGVTLKERHLKERQFFNTAPWNTIKKGRTGISSLKKFLAKLLYDHIRGEFPALVQELQNLVAETRNVLEALGAPRQTSVQQRQFLSQLAGKYQQIVQGSLRGGYDQSWDAQDVRKLRMHLHKMNEAFALDMCRRGHAYAFRKEDDSPDEDYAVSSPQSDVYDWIRRTYQDSRGSELHGTINPIVMENLFREQASKWATIAHDHLKDVHTAVSDFNTKIWGDLVVETTLKERMESMNTTSLREAKKNSIRQLELLLSDETDGILQTVNHYYADNIAAARADRVQHRFAAIGLEEGTQYAPAFAKILQAAQLSNEDQAVHDIHDTLKAYYKVALKRFCDSVVLQCVERCYVGMDGPLETISPAAIGGLTDSELADIAMENYASASQRLESSQRLARLEKALEIAERENRV